FFFPHQPLSYIYPLSLHDALPILMVGDRWLECLISIPIIAVVPFAAIIWALRQTAPTDLVRTGALGGLLAGAISAAGYALHCTEDRKSTRLNSSHVKSRMPSSA